MVDPSAALAPGETSFRTVPMHLDAALQKVLQSYEGTPFHQVPYEVIPPLSSPCDLYALGVLALRILFAGTPITLPIALDAKSVEELGEDARQMVRKSPGVAVGIAAVVGFFIARMLGGKRR